jgi:hypothetical protein
MLKPLPYPGILLTAGVLLITGIGWAALGWSIWLSGMLIGGGSIVVGVWLGMVVAGPTGLVGVPSKTISTEGDDENAKSS